MSRTNAWAVLAAVTVLVLLGLGFLASFRFPVPLVYPALPTPDYGMQEGIAYAGAILVVAVFVVAGVLCNKRPKQRGRLIAGGGTSIVIIGLVASVAALTLPAA